MFLKRHLSRALDEWEVFLDNVNRKEIALRLLNLGLHNKDSQFIFIRFVQKWLIKCPYIYFLFSAPKVLEIFKKNWRMRTETKL